MTSRELFSRYKTDAHMKSQRLWEHAQYLYRFKPDDVPVLKMGIGHGGPTFNQEAICNWYPMTQRKITGYTNHFRAGPTSSWQKQNSMYLFLWTFSFLLLLLVCLLLVLWCLFVLFSFYGLYLFWFWKRKSQRVKKHMVGLVGRWEWSVRNWGIGKNMVKIPYMNKCLIKNKINKFNTKNSQTSLCLYI